MRVARKKPAAPIVNDARLLEEIQRAGELGVTTRELGKRLSVEPARLGRALGRLNYQGLVRSGWVPYKGAGGGDPLQVAVWTAASKAEPPLNGQITLAGTPSGVGQASDGL